MTEVKSLCKSIWLEFLQETRFSLTLRTFSVLNVHTTVRF